MFREPEVEIPISGEDLFKIHEVGPKPTSPFNILVLDVETTGVSHDDDAVIEIGGTRVVICRDSYKVHSIQPVFNFLCEPKNGKAVSSEITNLTGITQEMVVGKRPDLSMIYEMIFWADLIVAHNAGFDRPFCEELLPILQESPKPWACSCWDPNWRQLGFSKRKLGTILSKMGYTFPAHRAISDTVAVAWALHKVPEVLPEIVKRGTQSSFELRYVSTPYKSNQGLKDRDFRFSNKKWVKSYDAIDELFDERRELDEYFQGFKDRKAVAVIKEIDPLSRFSKTI